MLCENQSRWIIGFTFFTLVLLSVILFGAFANTPRMVHLLSPENAEFELAVNGNFLIFWAVLLFTCLVGAIELFQLIDERNKKRLKIFYFILFYLLLLGIIASISRSLSIIRENYEIMVSGALDEGFKTYILNNQSIFDIGIVRSQYFEVIPNLTIVLVLSFIFLYKIGFWEERTSDSEKNDDGRIQGLIENLDN